MSREACIVARDYIGPYEVATDFLGLDHGFPLEERHAPVLWETMVFNRPGGKDGQRAGSVDCQRYTSRDEALEGHRTICQLVQLKVEQGTEP